MPKEKLQDYLRELVELGGSDLHLKVGSPARMRVGGVLRRTEGEALTPEFTVGVALAIMREHHVEALEERSQVDFGYSVRGVGRFRVNAFRQRGSVGLVFHRVRTTAVSLEEIAMPPGVRALADEASGLVVVTGGAGSGKTTTMAAMVDHINRSREAHIVTIEDPMEVIHADQLASVSQREIGFDVPDFTSGLNAALHQDPDVILVGELRDQATAGLVLSAAESGHLVITALATPDAAAAVSRMVDFFPPAQQHQIRARLAHVLRGVVSQRLVPRADGKGRVVAVEVMVANERIRACIMEPDSTQDLRRLITEGGIAGMQTFDEALMKLYDSGVIDLHGVAQASTGSDWRSKLVSAPAPDRAGAGVDSAAPVERSA